MEILRQAFPRRGVQVNTATGTRCGGQAAIASRPQMPIIVCAKAATARFTSSIARRALPTSSAARSNQFASLRTSGIALVCGLEVRGWLQMERAAIVVDRK